MAFATMTIAFSQMLLVMAALGQLASLIYGTRVHLADLTGVVDLEDANATEGEQNASSRIDECAGRWRNQKRARCDREFYAWIQKKSPNGRSFVINTRIKGAGNKLESIAACYMKDDCFRSPRQPSSINVEADPAKKILGLVWLSYDEWVQSVDEAWKKMRNHPTGLSNKNRKTLLIVPLTGGAASGVSGNSSSDFDQELATFPKMFYKSELWMQMYLIHRYSRDICGMAFVGNDPHQERLFDQDLRGPCEGSIHESGKLPKDERCNVALAFDVTYSGIQLNGDAQDMFGSSGMNLLRQDEQHSLIRSMEPYRKLVLLGASHNRWYSGYTENFDKLPYQVILGTKLRPGYSGSSPSIPGGQKPMLAVQHKIPDGASLDTTVAKHLEFLLCCCNFEVRRPPYKVYRTFSPKPCLPAPALQSSFSYGCNSHLMAKNVCHRLFPTTTQFYSSHYKPVVLPKIQELWRQWVLDSRTTLFRDLDTNNSGRLNEDEWIGIKPYLVINKLLTTNEVSGYSRTVLDNEFEYLCEKAPGCDPKDPYNRGINLQEFKAILEGL